MKGNGMETVAGMRFTSFNWRKSLIIPMKRTQCQLTLI